MNSHYDIDTLVAGINDKNRHPEFPGTWSTTDGTVFYRFSGPRLSRGARFIIGFLLITFFVSGLMLAALPGVAG